MKKIIILIALLASLISKAQCPAPSNLILSIPNPTSAYLSWNENEAVESWEVMVVPDFYIGAQLPTNGGFVAGVFGNHSFTFTNLPPAYGCYAFLVRAWCSPTNVSSWMVALSLGCSSDVHNYLATLSDDKFLTNPEEFQVFPNPATTNIQIKSTSKIRNIRIFDTLGKLMVAQQNTDDVNVENLDKGIYFIEASTENGVVYKKLIKE